METNEKELTREEILATEGCRTKKVSIPAWGGKTYIRVCSGVARDRFEERAARAKQAKKIDYVGAKVGLIVGSLCNKSGKLLFKHGDEASVNNLDSDVLDRLFCEVQDFSHLGTDDVEEAAGNSDGATSGASGSGSPSPLDIAVLPSAN